MLLLIASTKWLSRSICLGVGIALLNPSVASACAKPNQPAMLTRAARIDWEPSREIGLGSVSVDAVVTLDARGIATRVHILTPISVKALYDAVVQAARDSTYTPEIKNCHPTGGSLLVRLVWQPGD